MECKKHEWRVKDDPNHYYCIHCLAQAYFEINLNQKEIILIEDDFPCANFKDIKDVRYL